MILRSSLVRRSLWLASLLAAASAGCSSSEDPGAAGGGGSDDGGADATDATANDGSDAYVAPTVRAGELCFTPDPVLVQATWQPQSLVMAVGEERHASATVDPDFCDPVDVTLEIADPTIASAPTNARVDLRTPRVPVDVRALAVGKTTLTIKVPKGDGTFATSALAIDVRATDLPTCTGEKTGTVAPGGELALGDAKISLPAGAEKPNANSFLWHVDAFDAKIACGSMTLPADVEALGPAISITPQNGAKWSFPREIPISVPVNPARMHDGARLRHVQVFYSSPKFVAPRAIPVADPWIHPTDGGGYALDFSVPALGTYQVAIPKDAGTKTRTRRLTHRAVVGISMGGGGTAVFGARHHDKFDVLAPLGGPVDWTWMLDDIEHNHVAGFHPNDGDTYAPNAITVDELSAAEPPIYPYEHRSTFNQWWYEYPKQGNGGSFPRSEYTQIFRDLALMFGNPISQNDAPGAENLPAGVPPDAKAVVGDHPGHECAVWVDPIDEDPNKAKQEELNSHCPAERCKPENVLSLQNYYDDEFNPKGKWNVITVCDGSPQDSSKTPYANTWTPGGNGVPLELALAVDYNGNGVRDANEPIIRSGHEPWKDVGTDGKASVDEPGYQLGVNEDPAGDDYNAQFNPNGTEGDGRWQAGEPYDDFGLDGVPNTPDAGKAYDHGEGDGKFTVSNGLATFWERDSRSVLHQWSTPPGGAMTDAALSRVDFWTDGGTRDLFNFAVDAQHLAGSLAGRGRATAYFTNVSYLPGQNRADLTRFYPERIPWADVPGVVMHRYGAVDPTQNDIDFGSGQHVGTADEIAKRLQSALYFIGSRWPDAPHFEAEPSSDDPVDGAKPCEVQGNCTFDFTSKDGRTGPVGITLPPGYSNKKLQDVRYPVIYLLHGYGQGPADLEAAIVFLANWMNAAKDSSASRLSKAILVYVDGRCRVGKSGEPECIRGTFFTDSVRATGAKDETWWLDLMDYIDTTYRTMGPTDVQDTE